jgi:hypothetical protein
MKHMAQHFILKENEETIFELGIGKIPERKQPAIYVESGVEVAVLGYLRDELCADALVACIARLLRSDVRASGEELDALVADRAQHARLLVGAAQTDV